MTSAGSSTGELLQVDMIDITVGVDVWLRVQAALLNCLVDFLFCGQEKIAFVSVTIVSFQNIY